MVFDSCVWRVRARLAFSNSIYGMNYRLSGTRRSVLRNPRRIEDIGVIWLVARFFWVRISDVRLCALLAFSNLCVTSECPCSSSRRCRSSAPDLRCFDSFINRGGFDGLPLSSNRVSIAVQAHTGSSTIFSGCGARTVQKKVDGLRFGRAKSQRRTHQHPGCTRERGGRDFSTIIR